jgi:sialidase-1
MPRAPRLEYVRLYDDPRNFCAEVSVDQLPNGELVAVFCRNRGLAHTDTGTILLVRSADRGQTWSQAEPVEVFPQGEDYGYALAGVRRLANGDLLAHTYGYEFLLPNGLVDFQGGASGFCGVYVAHSADGGRTWSDRWKVNTTPMRTAAIRDAVVELPDGTWLLPLCGLRARAGMPEVAELEAWTAFIVASTDRGRRWSYWGTMAHDPVGVRSFWEPALLRLADGRLLGMLRAHHFPRQHPVHLTGVGHLYLTVSDDDGSTWSLPRRTSLVGHPADLIQLADGRVLCTYGRRVAPMGVYACLSDDGVTWDAADEFTIREYAPPAAPTAMGPGFPYHIGYPTALQLDDGRILTAYHLFNEAGRQYIEAAIFHLAE